MSVIRLSYIRNGKIIKKNYEFDFISANSEVSIIEFFFIQFKPTQPFWCYFNDIKYFSHHSSQVFCIFQIWYFFNILYYFYVSTAEFAVNRGTVVYSIDCLTLCIMTQTEMHSQVKVENISFSRLGCFFAMRIVIKIDIKIYKD